jgi:hypothetical protein
MKTVAKSVLIHHCTHEPVDMLFIHNFSQELLTLPLPEIVAKKKLVFVTFSDGESIVANDLIILEEYGFLWLRIENKL